MSADVGFLRRDAASPLLRTLERASDHSVRADDARSDAAVGAREGDASARATPNSDDARTDDEGEKKPGDAGGGEPGGGGGGGSSSSLASAASAPCA